MSDDLFEVPQQLSPRRKWMLAHNVTTVYSAELEDIDDPWCAFVGGMDELSTHGLRMEEDGRLCYGETEIDAICSLAKNQGWKLWNEEPRYREFVTCGSCGKSSSIFAVAGNLGLCPHCHKDAIPKP